MDMVDKDIKRKKIGRSGNVFKRKKKTQEEVVH
jgi:hypothetical protein